MKSLNKVTNKCEMCSSNRFISGCFKFKQLSLADKSNLVREQRLCYNCLHKGHIGRDYTSQHRCTVTGCERKHHFLLHWDRSATEKPVIQSNSDEKKPPKDSSQDGASDSSGCFASLSTQKGKAYLNVVPVRICVGNNEISCFVFLDQGSTNSLCDKRFLERLCVTGTKAEFSLSTLTNSVTQSGNKIGLKVSSLAGDGTLHLRVSCPSPGYQFALILLSVNKRKGVDHTDRD